MPRNLDSGEEDESVSSEPCEAAQPTSVVDRLRAWVWRMMRDFRDETSFWEELPAWLQWKIADYLWAILLMYL